MTKTLACPKCGETEGLRSFEKAEIAYPVTVTVKADGTRAFEYTGEPYETFDDGTVFEERIACPSYCGEYALADLDVVDVEDDADEDDE